MHQAGSHARQRAEMLMLPENATRSDGVMEQRWPGSKVMAVKYTRPGRRR